MYDRSNEVVAFQCTDQPALILGITDEGVSSSPNFLDICHKKWIALVLFLVIVFFGTSRRISADDGECKAIMDFIVMCRILKIYTQSFFFIQS